MEDLQQWITTALAVLGGLVAIASVIAPLTPWPQDDIAVGWGRTILKALSVFQPGARKADARERARGSWDDWDDEEVAREINAELESEVAAMLDLSEHPDVAQLLRDDPDAVKGVLREAGLLQG